MTRMATMNDIPMEQVAFDLVGTARKVCAARAARPYQVEIATECMGHLQSPRAAGLETTAGRQSRSVLIQSPTGSGKTFVGMVCAAVMQNDLGLSVGWCAGRRELLRQAERENKKFGFELEFTTISMYDREPPQVDVLVIDEAHHDGAMSMATLHGRIAPKFVIGLTATPFRRDRVKLCFEKVIRSCSIQRLVDDGYLSRYRHFTVPTWTPVDVAQLYARDSERWGKSLIFFHTRNEAAACLAELAHLGVRAELVTGTSDRERQIESFASGDVDVLLSMNVLTEGFDCPSLQTVFCRPASRAPTVQMCGRVFRLHAGVPLKQIVQVREAPMPFTRFVRPEEQHLLIDGEWRSLGATKALDEVVEAQRIKLAQVKVAPLPTAILRKQRSRRRRGARGMMD
ncbi:MAG: ATP-dependent helicase SrmB [Planctomycetota bacterium]